MSKLIKELLEQIEKAIIKVCDENGHGPIPKPEPEDRIFVCPECSMQFVNQENMNFHHNTEHVKPFFVKPEPDKWWVSCDDDGGMMSRWERLRPEHGDDIDGDGRWFAPEAGVNFYCIEKGEQKFLKDIGITLAKPGECIEIPAMRPDPTDKLFDKGIELSDKLDESQKQIQELQDLNTLETDRVRVLNREIVLLSDKFQKNCP